jgi:hypothetical protein
MEDVVRVLLSLGGPAHGLSGVKSCGMLRPLCCEHSFAWSSIDMIPCLCGAPAVLSCVKNFQALERPLSTNTNTFSFVTISSLFSPFLIALQVLEMWSASHGRPADPSSSSWRGVTIQHLQQLNSSSSSSVQQQQQQQTACGFAPACEQALLSLREAAQHLQQQQQQRCEMIHAADTYTGSSSSSSLWSDLAEDVPGLLRAESLQEVETVLGPEGAHQASFCAPFLRTFCFLTSLLAFVLCNFNSRVWICLTPVCCRLYRGER